MYLEIDMWKQFHLLPSPLIVGELTGNSEQHLLTELQSAQLNSVIGKFPSFAAF